MSPFRIGLALDPGYALSVWVNSLVGTGSNPLFNFQLALPSTGRRRIAVVSRQVNSGVAKAYFFPQGSVEPTHLRKTQLAYGEA